jgi:hypothetical protein
LPSADADCDMKMDAHFPGSAFPGLAAAILVPALKKGAYPE